MPCRAEIPETHKAGMAPAPRQIDVPLFPEGKRIAVTASFDDGHSCDRRVVAAFNQWGLKGTFNLNSSHLLTGAPGDENRQSLPAAEVKSLYEGHEVAVHTLTHPRLDRLPATMIAHEVMEDRKALEDLVGYPVRGMAYPFGTFNERVIGVLRALGFTYARTVGSEDKCFPPKDPLAWHTTGHQYMEAPSAPELFAKRHADPKYTGVFFLWGHSYEFRNRDDWGGLERIYKPLSNLPDVWYCTNIELFDYETARSRIEIAANRKTAFNPSALAVTLKADTRFITVPPGATVPLTLPAEE